MTRKKEGHDGNVKGMTIVEEIPRLATLARNDSSALRMTVWMVVEVLAWGAVVAAG